MPRTHRLPRRLVRFTGWLLSFALVVSMSLTGPTGITAKASRNLKTESKSLNPLAPQRPRPSSTGIGSTLSCQASLRSRG